MQTHSGLQTIHYDCSDNATNDLGNDRVHKPLLSGPKVFGPVCKPTGLSTGRRGHIHIYMVSEAVRKIKRTPEDFSGVLTTTTVI